MNIFRFTSIKFDNQLEKIQIAVSMNSEQQLARNFSLAILILILTGLTIAPIGLSICVALFIKSRKSLPKLFKFALITLIMGIGIMFNIFYYMAIIEQKNY